MHSGHPYELTKIKREQILVEVARWLSNFQKIENILGKKGTLGKNIVHQFDGIRNKIKTSSNKAEDAAKLMRASLKMRKGEPVLNICGLLESHGIRVIDLCKPDSKDFFGLSVADVNEGGPAVVVNTCDKISVERWIFTAAHELGHLIMHLSDYDAQCTVEEKKEEQEANAFAASFLMPDTAFLKEWHGSSGLDFVDRVIKVKRIFRVSYRTVLYRLAPHAKDINIWAHFQKEYKRKHRRALLGNDEPSALAADAFRATFPESRPKSEPYKLSPVDFIQDVLYGLVRAAIEQEKISLDRGAELLDISLQDMRERTLSWVA